MLNAGYKFKWERSKLQIGEIKDNTLKRKSVAEERWRETIAEPSAATEQVFVILLLHQFNFLNSCYSLLFVISFCKYNKANTGH